MPYRYKRYDHAARELRNAQTLIEAARVAEESTMHPYFVIHFLAHFISHACKALVFAARKDAGAEWSPSMSQITAHMHWHDTEQLGGILHTPWIQRIAHRGERLLPWWAPAIPAVTADEAAADVVTANEWWSNVRDALAVLVPDLLPVLEELAARDTELAVPEQND